MVLGLQAGSGAAPRGTRVGGEAPSLPFYAATPWSLGELAGTTLGCIINPTVFWVFYKTGAGADIADVPYARVYRGMAMLSVADAQEGLPRHCMLLAKIFFLLALAMCVFREVASRRQWRVRHYIPSTVALAVAFFVPPDMPIGMCIGSLLPRLFDAGRERMLSPAVASGLICGDGLGSLVSSMLTLMKMTAPICIKFFSRSDNERLDAFLATLPMT